MPVSPALTFTGEQSAACECGAGATAAISDINFAHELTAQLQALVLPLLPSDDGRSELAGRLFRETLRCSASALSRLQAAAAGSGGSSVDGSVDNRAVDQRSISTGCAGEKRKRSGREETPDSHKRRKNSHCCIATTVPYEDGYQWRKYGQKNISGDKYPRSYFRCTYNKEQNCPATKTVQQADDGESRPPKFYVNYIMEHKCRQAATDACVAGVQLPAAVTEYSSDNCSSEYSRNTVDIMNANNKQCDLPSPDYVDDANHPIHHPDPDAQENPVAAVKNPTTAATAAAAAAYDLDMPWAKILDSIEASSQL